MTKYPYNTENAQTERTTEEYGVEGTLHWVMGFYRGQITMTTKTLIC